MTIRNKLILYTVSSILLTLLAAGFVIDFVITDLYNDNAREELNQSYKNFDRQLTKIKNDIITQSIQISTENSVIAVSNIINRYQDKKNYQPLIFDNDKKKTATYLLNQIALTKSGQAVIYDQNGDIVAYAKKNERQRIAGISTFHDGKVSYLEQKNQESSWSSSPLPQDIQPIIAPLNEQQSFLAYSGKNNYLVIANQLVMQNSRIITRNLSQGRTKTLGVIRISKSLNSEFFAQATDKADTEMSLLLHNGEILNSRKQLLPIPDMKSNALLHGDMTPAKTLLQTNKIYYVLSYVWPTVGGNNYLLISLSKGNLISALNSTRLYFFIVFCIIASIIIVVGVYWLNRLISKPLHALAEQARLSGENRYPVFPVSNSRDEINLLGTVLNDMVDTIRNREKDLTDRTRQLNNAQHLAHIGDWELDHSTGTMQWSDEAYNIFDLNPDACTPSREAINSIMHPDDIEETETAFNTSIINKTPFTTTHRIIIKDNKIKFIRVSGETLFDDAGNAITSTGTMQDITEQTSKDEQLRRTQKMDALGKLTGGIAHDFNNMLGVIIGFAELLQMKFTDDDPKAKKYIKEIFQASERARKLTAKLLSFSRTDVASAVKTDINTALLEEQHMLEKTLTVRIKLKLKLGKNVWPVKLDKDELEDAIVNMSINSMHAMQDNGELILSTRNISLNELDIKHMEIPAGDYVLLSITDTGSGMDRDTIQKIFEPFYTTKDKMGTGLGMSQVYGFVKRSGGEINIYSELNHGTTINIYFPRLLEIQKDLIQPDISKNTMETDLTGDACILVVDDEESLQDLAKEILTISGYRVLTASSGKLALEILAKENIDILLSDVIMPEMDGYELASKVRKKYPLIKIQMVSGFSDIKNSENIINELYQTRLQKPFSSNVLLSRIKTLLSETK